jgi:hypothetical protein
MKISAILLLIMITCFSAGLSAQEKSVVEKTPVRGNEVSIPAAMSLDILPGGGHFYLGNYYSGAAFAVLKSAGILSGFFLYRSWQDKKSKEDGSVTRKRVSDRAAQRFTFAVFGSAALYGISWYKVYTDCEEINYRARPVFEVGSGSFDGKFNASAGLSFSF